MVLAATSPAQQRVPDDVGDGAVKDEVDPPEVEHTEPVGGRLGATLDVRSRLALRPLEQAAHIGAALAQVAESSLAPDLEGLWRDPGLEALGVEAARVDAKLAGAGLRDVGGAIPR